MAEEAVRVGLERSLAPHDQNLGQRVALVIPAVGQRTRVIPLGIGGTRDVGGSRETRGVAGIAGLHIAVVGRAEHHRGIQRHGATLAACAGHADDGLGAVLVDDALVVLLDDGKGLVPGALFPGIRVATLGAIALHRGEDTGGAVDVVLQRDAPRAQTTLGDGMVLVALDVLEPAVLVDVELETAADGMASRRRPRAGAGDGVIAILVAPGLADVVDVGKGIQLHDWSCLVIT